MAIFTKPLKKNLCLDITLPHIHGITFFLYNALSVCILTS